MPQTPTHGGGDKGSGQPGAPPHRSTVRAGANQLGLAPLSILSTYFAARWFIGHDPDLAHEPEQLAALAGAVAAAIQGFLTTLLTAATNLLSNTKWGRILLGSVVLLALACNSTSPITVTYFDVEKRDDGATHAVEIGDRSSWGRSCFAMSVSPTGLDYMESFDATSDPASLRMLYAVAPETVAAVGAIVGTGTLAEAAAQALVPGFRRPEMAGPDSGQGCDVMFLDPEGQG